MSGLATFALMLVLGVPEASPDGAVLAKEEERHDAVKRRDRSLLEALLAPEFVWVDESGFNTRAQVLERQGQGRYDLLATQMEGASVTWVSDDVALVLYRLRRDAWLDGRPQPSPVVSSSIWVKRGAAWLNVLYQETKPR